MRKRTSYTGKYGDELGGKLHSQLQRKSGISSGISRTKKQIAAALLGAEGGKARGRKLSKAERSEIARKGAVARWSKKKGGSK